MPFYEYKKHRQTDGRVVNPGFVMSNLWGDLLGKSDKTYVCYIPPESQRDFYIPDTLLELTHDEFMQRVSDVMGNDANVVAWAEDYWSYFLALDNKE